MDPMANYPCPTVAEQIDQNKARLAQAEARQYMMMKAEYEASLAKAAAAAKELKRGHSMYSPPSRSENFENEIAFVESRLTDFVSSMTLNI